MKTLVIILIVLTLAGGYLYWRLRPYIKMARQIFGATRNVQDLRTGRANSDELPRQSEKLANEQLVRCSSCGTWQPVSRAVRLGKSATYFCSHECLERGADSQSRTHKSAS